MVFPVGTASQCKFFTGFEGGGKAAVRKAILLNVAVVNQILPSNA
jgi:hypothetical protein